MKKTLLTIGVSLATAVSSQAVILYSNDFQSAGDDADFNGSDPANIGNGALTIGDVGDFLINGGSPSTIRTGGKTDLITAGDTVDVAEPFLLAEVTFRGRSDRENGFALVDSAGAPIISWGNTNGVTAFANGQQPNAFQVISGANTVLATVATGDEGTTALSNSSTFFSLRISINTTTNEGFLRYQDFGGDGTLSPAVGAWTNIATFTAPSTATVTGVFYGQSGGGQGADDIIVQTSAVPEPSSALLSLAGISLLGLRRRK